MGCIDLFLVTTIQAHSQHPAIDTRKDNFSSRLRNAWKYRVLDIEKYNLIVVKLLSTLFANQVKQFGQSLTTNYVLQIEYKHN